MRINQISNITRRQEGVALITVMLIVALATVLAISMSSRQQLDTHRSANILNFEQAYQYVLGSEAFAKQILIRDSKDTKNNKIDSFEDDWAQQLPPLEIEGGEMLGQLEDMHARFNLNSLVENGKAHILNLERFKRLLRNLELDENLASVIIDWIDTNETVEFSGAEDNEYLNMTPPYRAANQAMHDISELVLIKGFDYESFERLSPFVCVINSSVPINVNTASEMVIRSLVSDFSEEDAVILKENRKTNIYKSVDEFLQEITRQGKTVVKTGLTVSSQYFLLKTDVKINKIRMAYLTMLQRDENAHVKTLKRSRSIL